MLMYAHVHLLKNSNAQLQPYNQTKFSTLHAQNLPTSGRFECANVSISQMYSSR